MIKTKKNASQIVHEPVAMKNSFPILFFFLMFSISMKGMELVVSQEDPIIHSFRDKAKALKHKLQFTHWVPGLTSRPYTIPSTEQFYYDDLFVNPFRFLQYIHNKRYYDLAENDNFDLDELSDSELYESPSPLTDWAIAEELSLREMCENVRVNDRYSALGVAVLRGAGTASFPDRFALYYQKKIIQKLLRLGFRATPADQELAYLELYSRTPELTKIALTLLAGRMKENPESDFAQIPVELLMKIMSYVKPFDGALVSCLATRIREDGEPLIPRHLCTDCRKIRKSHT